jgi:hypothetical protein
MKILWVTSDCFGAQAFEERFTVEEIAAQLSVDGDAKVFEKVEGDDGYYFEVKLLEFGDVDPKFIEFVHKKIQDYDQSKACNFYVVGEELKMGTYLIVRTPSVKYGGSVLSAVKYGADLGPGEVLERVGANNEEDALQAFVERAKATYLAGGG